MLWWLTILKPSQVRKTQPTLISIIPKMGAEPSSLQMELLYEARVNIKKIWPYKWYLFFFHPYNYWSFFTPLTLPETNIAPENRQSQQDISLPKSPFSGATLVLGSVIYIYVLYTYYCFLGPAKWTINHPQPTLNHPQPMRNQGWEKRHFPAGGTDETVVLLRNSTGIGWVWERSRICTWIWMFPKIVVSPNHPF